MNGDTQTQDTDIQPDQNAVPAPAVMPPPIQPAQPDLPADPAQSPGFSYMGANAGPTAAIRPTGLGPNAVAAARYFGARQPNPMQEAIGNATLAGNPNDPIEQQQKAVQAAMKFQGTRGYQNDLQNGLPAEQAWAKWAPMMIGTGSAASVRALKPSPPTLRTVNGVLYSIGPDGKPKALTSPKPVAPPRDAMALQEHASILRQIEKAQEALDADPQDKLAQQRVAALTARKEKIENATRRPGVTPPPGGAGGSKIEKAKALHQAHPDWTKKDIIDAVNRGEE